MKNDSKKTFLHGVLASSLGIFISKALGLLYMSPFSVMATTKNMAFYSQAYAYFELLLNVCAAGFPFAIAALVAKYINRNDYKTVMLIRRLSFSLMLVSGFVVAIFFALISFPLAEYSLGYQTDIKDIRILQNCFYILTLAIATVPFLSVYRGFYQGLKELKGYGASQVLEQLSRIVILLGLSALCIYVLKLESIYAIYMAVLATSISAIITIIYFRSIDKRLMGDLKNQEKQQKFESKSKREVIHELLLFGLPFVLISILGNSMSLVNNAFFMNTVNVTKSTYQFYMDALGIIQTYCNKLTSIPQVLAIGFGAAIIPYLTVSLENRNWSELQKNVQDTLEIVLYIGMPLFACLLVLSEPIYYVFYPSEQLKLGTELLMWSSVISITGTISPICSSMMMTLRLRRQSIVYLLIGFVVKLITFFLFIKLFDYTGAISSSIVTSLVVIGLNLRAIHKTYHVHYRETMNRFLQICVGVLGMAITFVMLKKLGLYSVGEGRFITILMLVIYGTIGLVVYLYITSLFRLPQALFGKNSSDYFMKLLKRKR